MADRGMVKVDGVLIGCRDTAMESNRTGVLSNALPPPPGQRCHDLELCSSGIDRSDDGLFLSRPVVPDARALPTPDEGNVGAEGDPILPFNVQQKEVRRNSIQLNVSNDLPRHPLLAFRGKTYEFGRQMREHIIEVADDLSRILVLSLLLGLFSEKERASGKRWMEPIHTVGGWQQDMPLTRVEARFRRGVLRELAQQRTAPGTTLVRWFDDPWDCLDHL